MARPIELGLILEGEDAEEFLEGLKNPKKHLKELQDDPYKPRLGCDIDIIEASGFLPVRRQRIGKYRAEYFVDEEERTVYR